MRANSSPVRTTQLDVHPRLRETVARRLASPFRKPIQSACVAAFATLADVASEARRAFVLDAGCGTGESTITLSRRFPNTLVIGVDRSDARLARGRTLLARADAPPNARLLRCELVDFWRLARADGWQCARHFLLYPNPSPKPHDLVRRWHAHPAFADLLALGGAIELRTNWRVYADEFAIALACASREAKVVAFDCAEPLSPFERKYAASGHPLWQVLSPPPRPSP